MFISEIHKLSGGRKCLSLPVQMQYAQTIRLMLHVLSDHFNFGISFGLVPSTCNYSAHYVVTFVSSHDATCHISGLRNSQKQERTSQKTFEQCYIK